ncbi:MAG: phage/plasmid replication protein, II/X family [Pseudomonadota bacterium]
MIDWIKAIVPLRHHERLSSGEIQAIDGETGQIEWRSPKRLKVEGSQSSSVTVRSSDLRHVEIDGNPAKFLQGHNIFGSDDLHCLAVAFFEQVAARLGIEVPAEDRDAWGRGEYVLKRVDVTESFRLPSQADVHAWIRAAQSTVTGKHQAASAYAGDTFYLGKNSRRIATKVYAKAAELRKHKLPESLPARGRLLEFAEGLLRFEVVIRAMELRRRGLSSPKNWTPQTPRAIVEERVRAMRLNQKVRLKNEEIDDLPPRLRGAYALWRSGEDLRNIYSKATFYRYRAELLRYGVDLAAKAPQQGEAVPLIRFLSAEHVDAVPSWATAAGLLYEAELGATSPHLELVV